MVLVNGVAHFMTSLAFLASTGAGAGVGTGTALVLAQVLPWLLPLSS